MKYLKNVLHLFFPKICITCLTELLIFEKIICTSCRHDLPIICYTDFKKNKISNAFLGRIPVYKAIAFLYYRKNSKTKLLLHQLKYKGNQSIGTFIGTWFGNLLKESYEFNDIDYVVPVPLHKKKLKQRGYNQLTKFGIELSKQLNTTYLPNILIRINTSKTQTYKQRFERFNNNESKFYLTDIKLFANKHIVIIDDVITTGATLEACCLELLKTENIKISIITMAYTE